jgi:hypothetical protein
MISNAMGTRLLAELTLISVLVVIATTCGPRTEDGPASGGTTSTDGGDSAAAGSSLESGSAGTRDDAGVEEGCACIPVGPQPTGEPGIPVCGEMLCPEAYANCDGSCFETPIEIEDPGALTCALTALRDRTPGRLRWRLVEDLKWEWGYLLILEDGRAVRRSWTQYDLGPYDTKDAVLGALSDPEVLDGCMADADDHVRFECLRTALATETAICDEGWS